MKAMDERYDKSRALPREGMAKRGRDNPRRQIGLWTAAVVIPGFLIRLWLQADPDRCRRRPSRRKSLPLRDGARHQPESTPGVMSHSNAMTAPKFPSSSATLPSSHSMNWREPCRACSP